MTSETCGVASCGPEPASASTFRRNLDLANSCPGVKPSRQVR
jgi:hypothetical protein